MGDQDYVQRRVKDGPVSVFEATPLMNDSRTMMDGSGAENVHPKQTIIYYPPSEESTSPGTSIHGEQKKNLHKTECIIYLQASTLFKSLYDHLLTWKV